MTSNRNAQGLRHWINQFWFPEASAMRPALLRILVGGYALWYLTSQWGDFIESASSNPSLFIPVGVARILDEPISVPAFQLFYAVTIGLNVLFIVGLRFCYVGPFFAGCLLGLLCYRNSWSMIFHSENLLVLHVLVLGFTPSANALSLDSLTRRSGRSGVWVHGAWPLTRTDNDWRYGWICRVVGAVTVTAYGVTGVAKIAGPLGWSWASGAALQSYIQRDGIRKELLGDGATTLTWLLNDQIGLLTLFAVLTLILELGAPLFFLNARLARGWAILAWGMHLGILLIMGIRFRYQLSGVAFVSFFPLEKYFERFRAWMRTPLPDVQHSQPRP